MAVKFTLLSVLIALIVSTSLGQDGVEYSKDDEFRQWVSQFYGEDTLDFEEIYTTWRRNADFVKHHNSLGLSYTVSLNQFAHLESKDLVGKWRWIVPEFEQDPHLPKSDHDFPPSLDWRDKGVVPPVVEQGECGDSTLFSILDSIDSFWAIENGRLVMASRDECIDCCLKSSCNGGPWDLSLYQCVANLGGLASESEYFSPNHTCLSENYTPVVKINGGRSVMPPGSEEALAEVVARQPVAVGVDASHQSFQFYQDGVHYDPACSSVKLDHALLVVGYGTKDGEDFWIAKNSWGVSWGMNGYILMARNKNNNCGIASEAVYPY